MPRGFRQDAVCDTCGGPLGSRNKFGRCTLCRTASFKRSISYDHEPSPATMERIIHYQSRAALGLPLFAGSPWARLPGAHNRLGERQMKVTIATGTVAPAHKIE